MGYQAGKVLSDNLFDSNHLALQLGTQGQRKVTCLRIGDRARAGALTFLFHIFPHCSTGALFPCHLCFWGLGFCHLGTWERKL